MNQIEVQKILTENINFVLQFGVSKISLFGSYLKGTFNENSDIDFLVEFEQNKKSFKNFIHLNFFLEGLFHKKIDLITPSSLSKYFGDSII